MKKNSEIIRAPAATPSHKKSLEARTDPYSRLNRTYLMLSQINQALMRLRERQPLFEAACQIAVEQGGFRMAWVGRLNPRTREVEPVACVGGLDGYLEKLKVNLDDPQRGQGPTARAVKTLTHIVSNNIATDESMLPWREAALKLGYRSAAVFPLVVGGEAYANLNLYSGETDFFDDYELKLLDELAGDISFGLEAIEKDEHRRKAEEGLRESEERYATLAQILPVGIFRTDIDGSTTYVNPRWNEITGIRTEDALGYGWLGHVHPDDKEQLLKGWQEQTGKGQPSYSDYRILRPGGKLIWVMGQAVPEIGPEGQVLSYVGTITDITERKLADEALQESNELLSDFMAHSPIYTYIMRVTASGVRVVTASENFVDLTGIPGSRMAGKTMHDIFPREFADRIVADDLQVIASGKAIKVEEVLNERTFITIKFPIFMGEKKMLAGYSIDISDSKLRERELQRRLKDLQVLYESSIRLSSELGPKEIGRIALEVLQENLHWEYALILLQRQEGDGLEVLSYAAPNLEGRQNQAAIEQLYQQVQTRKMGITGWVLEHGEGVRCGDLSTDPRYVEDFSGIHSGLYAPMISGGRTIGVMAIESEQPDAFNELDDQLLDTLAKITANAIQRNRLRQQTENQLDRLAALRTIDQAISSSFDLHVTLDIFLRNAAAQLDADAAMLLLVDPAMNTLEFAAETGFRDHIAIRKLRFPMNQSHAGRAVMERRMVIIPDLSQAEEPHIYPGLETVEGFVTFHVVPLIVKGQIKGVLEIFHRSRVDRGPDWLDFLETLAGQAAIAIDNNQLFESLQRTNSELGIAYDETIEGWSKALDMRDRETEGHTQRVTRMTLQLGIAYGLSGKDLVQLRRGSLLHDIGKMGVPDAILFKTSELTPEETEIMRRHPRLAYEMLSPVTYLQPALDIPYCHHERWDGNGYPRRLKAEQIPLAARLFAVVDVWDALLSDRPYRKGWPPEKVLEYLQAQSGTAFDPQAVRLFIETLKHSNM